MISQVLVKDQRTHNDEMQANNARESSIHSNTTPPASPPPPLTLRGRSSFCQTLHSLYAFAFERAIVCVFVRIRTALCTAFLHMGTLWLYLMQSSGRVCASGTAPSQAPWWRDDALHQPARPADTEFTSYMCMFVCVCAGKQRKFSSTLISLTGTRAYTINIASPSYVYINNVRKYFTRPRSA